MASTKRDLSIPWPFAPHKVGLNTDTSLLKLVAMITMFVDHAGKMLFPDYEIMRIIGRLAFPIYAYCLTVGCVYTRDPLRYLKRIILLALISQPIYAVALAHESKAMYMVSFTESPVRAVLNFYLQSWSHPNVLVSLAVGLVIIWTIRERHLILTAAMYLLCWKIQGKLDYGIRGVTLMVLFYLFCSKWWLSLPAVLSYMVWWGMKGSTFTLFGYSFGIQIFAVFSLLLIYIHTRSRLKINKWLFYFFYPAHMIIIMALDRFVF